MKNSCYVFYNFLTVGIIFKEFKFVLQTNIKSCYKISLEKEYTYKWNTLDVIL